MEIKASYAYLFLVFPNSFPVGHSLSTFQQTYAELL